MKDKIFIYSEAGKKQQFIKDVTDTLNQANDLIQKFNSFQDFRRIETLADFEKLYSDPLAMFDKTILENTDIKTKANLTPEIATLCTLFQIDRPGYMAAIGQSEPLKDDCPDCKKKTQSIKVKNVRSNAEYNKYAEFLLFINGLFQLNNSAVNELCDKFNIYAETPEQITLYNEWQSLCNILNHHDKRYTISPSGKDQISKALKLLLSEGMSGGRFIINNMALSEQIKYLDAIKNLNIK